MRKKVSPRKKADEKIENTYSVLDVSYLRQALASGHLTKDKIVKAESIKSGLTIRGVRRAIRKAIQRGHSDLSPLVD